MAIIYAQNVSELAIIGTHAGRPVANVLHFVNDEGALSDEAKARDILNNWQDHIMSCVNAAYALVRADWRSLDPDDTNGGTLAPDPAKNIAGTATGDAAPPNVALLVRKQTNNRQRGQRDGRMFLAGVTEGSVDNAGNVSSGHVTFVNDKLEEFVSGVNDDQFGVGGGSGLVVLNTTPASRQPGSQPVTLTYRTVSGMTCDTRAASQRDRLR